MLYTPVVTHTFLDDHPRREGFVHLSREVRAVRSLGSVALELCALASGRGDLFLAMGCSPWDYSAAGLILQEAGGQIGFLDGSPLSVDGSSGVAACANPSLWRLISENYLGEGSCCGIVSSGLS